MPTGLHQLRVRDARIRDASKHAVDIRTTGPWTLTRAFLLAPTARAATSPLLNIDSGVVVSPASPFQDVRLQAGEGQTLTSTGTQCASFGDPLGGPYLSIGATTTACF